MNATRTFLEAIVTEPEIESKPKKSSRGGKAPAPRPTALTDCDHDTTKAARAKCRRDRAKLAAAAE